MRYTRVRPTKPIFRQLYKGEMQISCAAGRKYLLRQRGGALRGLRLELPDDDIEFRRAGQQRFDPPAVILAQAAVKLQGGSAAAGKAAGESCL